MEEGPRQERAGDRCTECGAPLQHDQRYCVACGARRSALPGYVSGLIAGLRGRGRQDQVVPNAEASPPAPGPPAPEDPATTDPWLITPRAAAAAVLGMLGFGVIVGALVGGASASLIRPVLLVFTPVHKPPAVVASNSGPSSAGTPTVRTITVVSGGGAAGGAAAAGGGVSTSTTPTTTVVAAPPTSSGPLPPVKHVWLIVLSEQGYQATFGHSTSDPYLAGTLVKQGLLIPYYYGVAGGPLANEIALVSGQGPTPQTLKNCPRFSNIVPGTRAPEDQIVGHGCVYPRRTKTLGDQLVKAHMTWKTYIQTASGKNPKREMCHPKVGHAVPVGGVYAAWRNPFLYFQPVTGKKNSCPKANVSLKQLATDLKKTSTTPNLSYIVADLCDDASSIPCRRHGPAGMGPADRFLKSVVPEIIKSKAYKADGLVAITFDNAPTSGTGADTSACCNTPVYPNLPPPSNTGTGTTTTTTQTTPAGTSTTQTTTTGLTTTQSLTIPVTTTGTSTTGTTTTGATTTGTTTTTTTTSTVAPPPCSTQFGGTCPTGGGGQLGLLLLSPYVLPGTQDPIDYFDHFSLLASLETLLGLPRLGYASDPTLAVFQPGIFRNYAG